MTACIACALAGVCQPGVFVVDDDAAIRDSLVFLLASLGHPVQAYASAETFLAAGHADRPGCLVLDVRMPGMSGLELQQALNQAYAALSVVFISGHGDIPMVVRAMRGGAITFLEKPFNDQMLLDHVAIGLHASAERCAAAHSVARVCERLEQLTQRERDVLDRVVLGRQNKQIAHDLDISIKTVETHRAHVMVKMEAASVADLTRMLLATTAGKP